MELVLPGLLSHIDVEATAVGFLLLYPFILNSDLYSPFPAPEQPGQSAELRGTHYCSEQLKLFLEWLCFSVFPCQQTSPLFMDHKAAL